MDDQAGRHARALEQVIYPQHCSFRSQPIRLSELGVPEHRANCVQVQIIRRRSPPSPTGYIAKVLFH